MTTAREIASRLALRRSRPGEWRGACPCCGYPTGLVVSERGSRAVWWCASCGSGPDLTRAILGGNDNIPAARYTPREPAARIDWQESPAKRLWRSARPVAGTLAETYLLSRGLDLELVVRDDFRFLPHCPHPSREVTPPAMLALVRNAATLEPQAIHRTYLRADGGGKASVEPARASLGPIANGVVMIGGPHEPDVHGGPIVIGEGIETTASAAQLINGTAWAALSAGNLAGLTLPDDASEVVIAGDADPAGERAAWEAATRWRSEGRAVRVVFPTEPGADFNDVLAAVMADIRAEQGGMA